ncbi:MULTISPECIES: NADPH-dependent F420 reductase [Methylobacterium]|uniref:NADPH-dependent F420 reductase n=1 Tax=Methylobacterium TaxID=407 RepID=UPI0010429633|nr:MULTISPECIES: NAD(P)-binding domain-containing protein [Methylobacterium]MDR7040205.1 putative dinucleotide-binding enzyme [Methylobacterium sp. BE186]
MRSDLTRRAALALALALPALPAGAQEAAGQKPLRIGIIGAGKIGGTIGALWVKAGHEVMFSSRHPEELTGLVEGLGARAKAGTPAEAVRFGEAVFVAVPYKAYPQLRADLGEALKGRIVLDAGNATQARDGDLYTEAQANGIGTTSAKYLAGARLVRAFNAANYRLFEANANRPAPRMAVPIAGDDEAALEMGRRLVSEAGFDPVVVGTLTDADRFAMGSPGFGHVLGASELRAKLGLAP